MEAALKMVLKTFFEEYVSGLENVEGGSFPITLRDLKLKEKKIQEDMEEHGGTCPFDLTDGKIGSISLTPGWTGVEVVATNIVLNLAFSPMKAMRAAMRPNEDFEDDLQNQVPMEVQQQMHMHPPAPVAPRFCTEHDSSEKRVKCEPMMRECTTCHMKLQTNYKDFRICPPCSEKECRCMICGNNAPQKGNHIPLQALPPPGQLPNGQKNPNGMPPNQHGQQQMNGQMRHPSMDLPPPPPTHGGQGSPQKGQNDRNRGPHDHAAPPPPPPQRPPGGEARPLRDVPYGPRPSGGPSDRGPQGNNPPPSQSGSWRGGQGPPSQDRRSFDGPPGGGGARQGNSAGRGPGPGSFDGSRGRGPPQVNTQQFGGAPPTPQQHQGPPPVLTQQFGGPPPQGGGRGGPPPPGHYQNQQQQQNDGPRDRRQGEDEGMNLGGILKMFDFREWNKGTGSR